MSNFTMPTAAVLAEIPRDVRFQIVPGCAEPPSGDGWLHEIKHDGHRLLAIIAGGELRLMSRNGHDRTSCFMHRSSRLPPPDCRQWCSTARSPCPMSAALRISMD